MNAEGITHRQITMRRPVQNTFCRCVTVVATEPSLESLIDISSLSHRSQRYVLTSKIEIVREPMLFNQDGLSAPSGSVVLSGSFRPL